MEDDDLDLFKQSVKVDNKINFDGLRPSRKTLPAIPAQRIKDEQQVLDDMFSEHYEPADLERGDELLFSHPSVSHASFKKLRQGRYSVQGELDLHGLTVKQARQQLTEYLVDCRKFNKRCVRIIHGKGLGSPGGKPVIKNKLNLWLRQRDDVLAFCSARAIDGGTGAIYLLLRKG